VLHRLLGSGFHNLVIGQQQIVAAHAGLAREAGGDDHNIGTAGGRVIVRAGHRHVVALHRARLGDVQALALRNAFHDIHEHHVGQFFAGQTQRAIRAHVARAHYRYFFTHEISFLVQTAAAGARETPPDQLRRPDPNYSFRRRRRRGSPAALE